MRSFATNGAAKVLELAMKLGDAQKLSFGEEIPRNVLLVKRNRLHKATWHVPRCKGYSGLISFSNY